MKRMIENITGNYSASASVVDGTLILSLPDAITPVVWRLDLGQARASAMEVRTRDDGTFLLALKTPRGDVNDIAGFASKGKAVSALMSVTRAMEQAHGQIRPASNDSQPYNPSHLPVPVRGRRRKTHDNRHNNGGRGWIGGVVAIAIILVLGSMVLNMGAAQRNLNAESPAAGSARNDTGLPVSADEFLKNR